MLWPGFSNPDKTAPLMSASLVALVAACIGTAAVTLSLPITVDKGRLRRTADSLSLAGLILSPPKSEDSFVGDLGVEGRCE